MNLSISVSAFLTLYLLSLSVLAEQSLIPVFEHSKVEYQKRTETGEYAFLLSTPKRINNALSIESEQRVNGERINTLISIDDGFSSEQAFRFYQRYLSEHGKILYQCEQYDCGSSNYWANSIFNERKLYGRDNNQYYVVGKVTVGGEEYWLSVYSVMNGRRQNFVYMSHMAVEKGVSAPGSIDQWRAGHRVDGAALSKAEVGFLSDQLASDPALVVWIAAFANSSVTETSAVKLLAQSEKSAQSFRRYLISELQITEDRVKVKALGPFSSNDTRQQGLMLFLLHP